MMSSNSCSNNYISKEKVLIVSNMQENHYFETRKFRRKRKTPTFLMKQLQLTMDLKSSIYKGNLAHFPASIPKIFPKKIS